MGDWGYGPYDNDDAADWFHKFWTKGGFPLLIEEIENFDETEECYDSLRAAAYLLQTLGIAYVWPYEYLDKLKTLLDKTIVILTNMIEPPNDDWVFLDMGGDVDKLIESVKEQISILQERRKFLIN